MTLEGTEFSERVLVSYDVSGELRSKAVRVCQIVFGRVRRIDGTGEVRETKGFIHRPGVVWIGQSVLAMSPEDALDLRTKLGGLGVHVATARIHVRREAFEAFRKPWARLA